MEMLRTGPVHSPRAANAAGDLRRPQTRWVARESSSFLAAAVTGTFILYALLRSAGAGWWVAADEVLLNGFHSSMLQSQRRSSFRAAGTSSGD